MTATYRLQLTPDVGFAEVEAVGGGHQTGGAWERGSVGEGECGRAGMGREGCLFSRGIDWRCRRLWAHDGRTHPIRVGQRSTRTYLRPSCPLRPLKAGSVLDTLVTFQVCELESLDCASLGNDGRRRTATRDGVLDPHRDDLRPQTAASRCLSAVSRPRSAVSAHQGSACSVNLRH